MPLPVPLNVVELEKLVHKFGTPLQLYSEKHIIDNAKEFSSTCRKYFPNFQQYYAVKALPNPAILKILTSENIGFGVDCSSTAELYIVQKLGIPGAKVIYTSNYTSKKDLQLALDQKVIINLDDVSLIDSILELNNNKMPEMICFRLNPGLGRTDSSTKSNVLGGPSAKFGVAENQILEAYRKSKHFGAKRFGLHMMTGSCVLNDEYWQETVTIILNTVLKIKKDLDIDFEFINIGGGLGIPYRPEEKAVDINGLMKKLRGLFDQILAKAEMKPQLAMENGRYLTGPYGWLIAQCQAIKRNDYGVYYGLDACMANLMRPGMYGAYHHITIPKYYSKIADDATMETAAIKTQRSNVVGTLCENNDWFAKDRLLPEACVGDLFVIHDTGAHSHSMGFQYNGKLRAPEVLLRVNGEVELIRERETVEGLFSNCRIPTGL